MFKGVLQDGDRLFSAIEFLWDIQLADAIEFANFKVRNNATVLVVV
ncbi:MAG: hypothetical protein HC860_17585 [Alkalinema sp. RU_4_3]|nr:hypothetical protein [Alkalinema sp. RU_4_3]